MPHREPLRVTVVRTVSMALIAGAVIASRRGGLAQWPAASAVMLWPSLGGHFVEVWFLNRLRPRLSESRGVQIAARAAVWFVGGAGLALGMGLTAIAVLGLPRIPSATWWIGGLAFIGVELVAHVVLQLRGRPSVFNGRG